MRPTLLQRPWSITVSAIVCLAVGILAAHWLTQEGPSAFQVRQRKLAGLLDDERPAGLRSDQFVDQLMYRARGFAPKLVALLAHPDPHVQEAAAECLRSAVRATGRDPRVRVLDESSLAALVDAHRRGLWVSDAIGAIDTPDAHDFLIEAIRREPEKRWYLTRALSSPTAITGLVGRLRSPEPIDPPLVRAMGEVLRRAPIEPDDAILAQLVALAQDSNCADENRRHAIRLLGVLGPAASGVRSALFSLASSQPALAAQVVNAALLQIDAHESVAARVARIEAALNDDGDLSDSIPLEVRAIAQLRAEGRSASPLLVRLARHDDSDIRHAAVVALAFVDSRDPGVADVLTEALQAPDDWLLNARAAEALGRLHCDETGVREALRAVGDAHWDPAVRARARRALAALDGHAVYDELDEREIHWAFFADLDRFEELRDAPGETVRVTRALSVRTGPSRLPGFQARLIGRRAGDISYVSPHEGFVIATYGSPEVHCGVYARDGFILGEDRGEFGSGLYFVDRRGAGRLLGLPNVYALFRMPFGIVAVTGAAMVGDGALWLIDDSQPGIPKARRWKRLPFDPGGAGPGLGLLPNGDLLIRSVVLTRDGRLEWTPEMRVYLERRYGLRD